MGGEAQSGDRQRHPKHNERCRRKDQHPGKQSFDRSKTRNHKSEVCLTGRAHDEGPAQSGQECNGNGCHQSAVDVSHCCQDLVAARESDAPGKRTSTGDGLGDEEEGHRHEENEQKRTTRLFTKSQSRGGAKAGMHGRRRAERTNTVNAATRAPIVVRPSPTQSDADEGRPNPADMRTSAAFRLMDQGAAALDIPGPEKTSRMKMNTTMSDPSRGSVTIDPTNTPTARYSQAKARMATAACHGWVTFPRISRVTKAAAAAMVARPTDETMREMATREDRKSTRARRLSA